MGVVVWIYIALGLIPGVYWALRVGVPKAADQFQGILEVGGDGSLVAGFMMMVIVIGFFLVVGVVGWPFIFPSARRAFDESRGR